MNRREFIKYLGLGALGMITSCDYGNNPTKDKDENINTTIDYYARKMTEAIDYKSTIVRDFTLEHISPGNNDKFNQVLDIYDYINENWSYVEDPYNEEYFQKASETIDVGLKGDCDDYAILMASCLASIGNEPRIVLTIATSGLDKPSHVYPELLIGPETKDMSSAIYERYEKSTQYVKGKGTWWLNLDWNDDYPGGIPFHADKSYAIYLDGTYE